MISRITRQKKKPGKSGLVGEAKSRSATAIKHDLVLKTSFSALTPFSGGKLTPFGFLRGGSRLYVCIECTLVYFIIMDHAAFVKPCRTENRRKIRRMRPVRRSGRSMIAVTVIFFTNFRETIDIRRESAV